MYIVALWWQPLTINILNSEEKSMQLYNQYLTLKSLLELVAYTDRDEINEKISSSCVIQG